MELTTIIPTYKRNDFLPRAIESVIKEDSNAKIIVVDDNDSDTIYRNNNIELMKKYEKYPNILYLTHEHNKNGAAARNTALEHVTTEYVTFLDDDDEFCNNRLSKIEEKIKENKYDFICTGMLFNVDGKFEHSWIPNLKKSIKELQYQLLCIKPLLGSGSNMVCKTSIVKKIGGFDEKFVRNQDIEFMIRYFSECTSIYCIEEYLAIKNMDSKINIPSFEKMREVKQMLLTKFKDLIKTYSLKEQNCIYTSNYYELLSNAIRKKDKEDIKKTVNFLKENNVYSIKDVTLMRIKIFLRTCKFSLLLKRMLKRSGI